MTSDKQVFGANVRTIWDGITALCTDFPPFACYFELMYGRNRHPGGTRGGRECPRKLSPAKGNAGGMYLNYRSGNVIENKGSPSGKCHDVNENRQVTATKPRYL